MDIGIIKSKKTRAHILMIVLVLIWGFDYVPAKWALEIMPPWCLMFFKFAIAFFCMLVLTAVKRNRVKLVRIKDIPVFIACALFGQILYFFCEYSAMDYMPVSLLTIMLAFVPALSVVMERIIYKRHANGKIYIGIGICLLGIVLVVGADFGVIFQGRGLGYLLAIGGVFTWNIYNFITAALKDYDSITLTMTQTLCTGLILAPFALSMMPGPEAFSGPVVFGILWIGIVDSGMGYLIMVYALKVIGPTPSALYSDFMPVTTAFFGAVFLGESITWLQALGGIIVIATGFIVIREKGLIDEQRLQGEHMH